MIGRRDLLRAAVAGELTLFSRSAFGQARGTAKRRVAPAATNVQADERVNRVLDPVRNAHHLPGLIGAILTGNRLAAIGAIGIRKIGSSEPIRATDQVHLGSNTKAMTATVIGMLVDSGKLTWASRIRDVSSRGCPRASPGVSDRDALPPFDPPRRPAPRRPVVGPARAKPRPSSDGRS